MSAEQQPERTTPRARTTSYKWGKLLEECEAVGGEARIVWVSEEFLEENGVEPFTEMPLWVPREYAGMQEVDCGRAIVAGLTFRPVSETIGTLEWDSKGVRLIWPPA